MIAVDASTAMAVACRERGLDVVVGDARRLPFASRSLDAVVAAWMLYYVAPATDALEEFARVLRPGGTLVAVTNGRGHLAGLWALAGLEHEEPPFSRENGEGFLSRHFDPVARHDVETEAYFEDRRTAAGYLESVGVTDASERLPAAGWPRTVAGASTVFVAGALS